MREEEARDRVMDRRRAEMEIFERAEAERIEAEMQNESERTVRIEAEMRVKSEEACIAADAE